MMIIIILNMIKSIIWLSIPMVHCFFILVSLLFRSIRNRNRFEMKRIDLKKNKKKNQYFPIKTHKYFEKKKMQFSFLHQCNKNLSTKIDHCLRTIEFVRRDRIKLLSNRSIQFAIRFVFDNIFNLLFFLIRKKNNIN